MVSILVNGGVLLAHRMPYFSVLGILKYDSLVGQLTSVLCAKYLINWKKCPHKPKIKQHPRSVPYLYQILPTFSHRYTSHILHVWRSYTFCFVVTG